MSTVCDYIRWFADYPFEKIPLNGTDALIFCALSYFEIDEERSGGTVLVRDLPALLEEGACRITIPDIGSLYEKILREAAQSERFGDLELVRFCDVFSDERAVQFSAVTVRARGLFDFAVFRGTDATIAGWREDFMLSFTLTEAQELALAYVKGGIRDDAAFYIGGHSKGGNLALYAACMLDGEEQEKLERVWLFDSPGFCKEVLDPEMIRKIDQKITSFVPVFSVVGQVFSPDYSNQHIIVSPMKGLLQHVIAGWQVCDGKLEESTENDPRSVFFSETMERWLENVTLEERRAFTREMFDALEADGAVTLYDLTKDGGDGIDALARRLINVSGDVKRTAAELTQQAIFDGIPRRVTLSTIWQEATHNEIIIGIVMILSGIISMVASDKLLELISIFTVASLALMELAVTVRRLVMNGWNFARVRERIFIFIGLLATMVFLIIKDNAMFFFGSLLISVMFFVLAYLAATRALSRKYSKFRRVLLFAETGMCAVMGVTLLVINQKDVFAYALFVGAVLITGGILRLADAGIRQLVVTIGKRREKRANRL